MNKSTWAAALSLVVGLSVGAVTTSSFSSPEPVKAPDPVVVHDVTSPDKWRSLVCNAKNLDGATETQIIDWLVDSYFSTPKSARTYVELVYPTCDQKSRVS